MHIALLTDSSDYLIFSDLQEKLSLTVNIRAHSFTPVFDIAVFLVFAGDLGPCFFLVISRLSNDMYECSFLSCRWRWRFWSTSTRWRYRWRLQTLWTPARLDWPSPASSPGRPNPRALTSERCELTDRTRYYSNGSLSCYWKDLPHFPTQEYTQI